MKVISFKGYEFNPKDVSGEIQSVPYALAEAAKRALNYCPDNVIVKNYKNTVTISLGDKSMSISVWLFKLSDWKKGRPFNYFLKDGSDMIAVWGCHFYDKGKFVSDVAPSANLKYALGYKLGDEFTEFSAMEYIKSKPSADVSDLRKEIEMFFTDADPLVDLIIDAMPNGSKVIKRDKISCKIHVDVKDHLATVEYKDHGLTATIHRKRTLTDDVYGVRYYDYTVTHKFNTPEDVKSYDWNKLWDDLYEHRAGEEIYRGTLGT